MHSSYFVAYFSFNTTIFKSTFALRTCLKSIPPSLENKEKNFDKTASPDRVKAKSTAVQQFLTDPDLSCILFQCDKKHKQEESSHITLNISPWQLSVSLIRDNSSLNFVSTPGFQVNDIKSLSNS